MSYPHALLLCFCCLLAAAARGQGGPPNILIILIDDLGWKDLRCYGAAFHDTPNLDRLAGEGVRFTQAYASAAICSPTRAALLTGRAPARVGLTDYIQFYLAQERIAQARASGRNPTEYRETKGRRLLTPPDVYWLEQEEITLAEVLKPRGYETAYVGKWHLGWKESYPETQGFDLNVGGCELGMPGSYFDPYRNDTYAKEGFPTLPPRKTGEYLEDRLCDETVSFIRRRHDRPFFLVHAAYAVHTPIQGPADLVAKYNHQTRYTPRHPVYAAMVASVDRQVGAILGALREQGLEERTLVVFTSDNGGAMTGDSTYRPNQPALADNTPLRGGKGYPFEGGLRVPLIIKWPGVTTPGRTESAPVITHDLFPTLCEIAGTPLPEKRAIDGMSLAPLLAGRAAPSRESLFWHFPHYRGDHVVPYSIVRKGPWKLIKQYDEKPFQLYKLDEDPSELHDLSEAQPGRTRELDQLLSGWLASVGAQLPKPAPVSP